MLKTYMKIAWRNLMKDKAYSMLNIMGLGLGVASCILIGLYINHEMSYDSEVSEGENVFRLYKSQARDGETRQGIAFSANTASTIAENFSEVTDVARLMPNALFPKAGENQISIGDDPNQFYESGFTYADPALLEILDIHMIHGDQSNALDEPLSIVISESKAKKLFQDENPVGKIIYLNGNKSEPTKIGGVMLDSPSNSHLDYDYLLTLTDVEFGEGEQTRWLQSNYACYLKFRPGTDIAKLEDRISDDFVSNYLVPALKADNQAVDGEIATSFQVKLQSLSDIHLMSAEIREFQTRGDIRFVWLFGAIGLFIILIASINYINLSTARSANRAKEVGLRKVVGSTRCSLILQFLTESILTVSIAFTLGLVISKLALKPFNKLADLSLSIPSTDPYFMLTLLTSVLSIGLLAGLYPAFYLSSFKPNDVLKGKIRQGAKSAGVRSTLVVFQFAIAIILISATLIVNKQLNFILNSNVGFQKVQVAQLYGANMLREKTASFRSELENIPGVSSASVSDYLPISNAKRNGSSFYLDGKQKEVEAMFGQAWAIDDHYLQTLEIKLVDGRDFDGTNFNEERTVIINQRMAENLNLEDPIGKKIARGNSDGYEIVGLVEDFNFSDLKSKVRPLAMYFAKGNSIISIKIDGSKTEEALAGIEEKWGEFLPHLAPRITFMDESFALMFDNVARMRTLFSWFTRLAILIACLGLFTLSAFFAEQRKKEMSIRKVLGASFQQIFALLSKQFIILILISLLIVIPATIYFMQKWLQDYEYKINISWEIFASAGVAAFLIAISTVGYHAIRSAMVNPTINLKNE